MQRSFLSDVRRILERLNMLDNLRSLLIYRLVGSYFCFQCCYLAFVGGEIRLTCHIFLKGQGAVASDFEVDQN